MDREQHQREALLDANTRVLLCSVALVIVGLVLLGLGLHGPYYRPIDDAYISYRYAKNMVDGHGLTWNAGEAPVEGFTNFLLVLIEVPLIALGIEPLRGAQVLSIGCLLTAAWLSWRWIRAQLPSRAAMYVAALAVTMLLSIPFLPFHLLGGLETASFALHLLLPGFLLQRWLMLPAAQRPRVRGAYWLGAAAFAGFVSGLCRPEGFIVSGATLGLAASLDMYDARAEEALLRRVLVVLGWVTAAFVAPTLLYQAWRYLHFGDLLPNSFHIKVDAVSGKHLPGLPQLIDLAHEPAVRLLLVLAVLRIVFFRSLRRTDLLLALPLVFAATFYLRSEHIMAFNHRFYVPYMPFLVLFAAPSLTVLSSGGSLARGLKGAVFAAAFSYAFVLSSPVYAHFVARTWPKQPTAEETHFMLGKRMARLPDVQNLLIVGPDAGAMPYFSNAKWLDPIGLNDNFIARHVRASKATLIDYMFRRKPDIFILCKRGHQFVRGFPGPLGNDTERIFRDPRFLAYTQVARYQKNSGGRYAYVFYARRDLATLDDIRRVLAR